MFDTMKVSGGDGARDRDLWLTCSSCRSLCLSGRERGGKKRWGISAYVEEEGAGAEEAEEAFLVLGEAFLVEAFLGLEAGLAPVPRVEEVDAGFFGLALALALAAFLGLAEAFLVVVAFLALVAFLGLDAADVLAALRTGLLDAVLLRFVEVVFFSADPAEEEEDEVEGAEDEEEEAFLVDLDLEDRFFLPLRSGLSLYEALTLTKDEPSPRASDCLICLRAVSLSIL